MLNSRPINMAPFRHLYPFESRFMDMDGFKYHYVDEGAGSPVIMVHGNPTWSFYYRQLIQALSPQYRAIAVDHVGCGLSDKPSEDQYAYTLDSRINDLENFISRLELKETLTLVLHDWGGMIGVAYALRHLDMIEKIILLNTAAFFPPPGRFPAPQAEIDPAYQTLCKVSGSWRKRFCTQRSFHGHFQGIARRCENRVDRTIQFLAESDCHTQVCGGHPPQARRS